MTFCCFMVTTSPYKILPPFHGAHKPSFRMCNQTTLRRSGNYGLPKWDYTYIQSLNTHSTDERLVTRRDELKKRMKDMVNNGEMEELEKVELIDDLQRLGCSYHFEDEIKEALMDIYMKRKKKGLNGYKWGEKDLYATALEFRVFRQNGFYISQDVFDGFMDKDWNGINGSLCQDTKGLLSLYEASFLSMEGEKTLELAKHFSTKHLKRITNDQNLKDPNLWASVQRALELPLHWRVPRLETKFYIDSYQRKTTSNPLLLELAKLDFNILQAIHLEDLKFSSRWWKNSNIAKRLPFVRDRIVEDFIWTVGMSFNPKYGNFRRVETKLICLICTIDDIYDVYGTLDELQLFTDTIERWDDITKVGHLPEYMKFCYFSLHNHVNEVAYDILNERDILVIQYLRKAFEMERGDVPKAIQCYMNETKASVKEAGDHIDFQINEFWKKMNKVRLEDNTFSKAFMEVAMNFVRMAQFMYQHGDGHGINNFQTQSCIQSMLFDPIPIIYP